MTGKEDDQDRDAKDRVFDDASLRDPRRQELGRLKVRLTTGAEMELGLARAVLDILRVTQEREPDQFSALVSFARPKGSARPTGEATPSALAALRERGLGHRDGSVAPAVASVPAASYKETPEGVVLIDPIIYPGRKCYDELDRLEREFHANLGRLLREEKIRGEHKNRGDEKGPSR